MKVVEYDKYGTPAVLQIKEVEKPSLKENEVMVKIFATSVTATECAFRKGEPLMTRLFTGLIKPKLNRLGEELSGEVIAIGKNVKQYQIGDQVFGTAGPKFGANAEIICIPENGVLTKKPINLSHVEAAASIDGFLTALPFLRDTGKIKSNFTVLVNGASGSVGSAAIQVAKHFGAHVTGICSGGNIELVKSIGADHVIDYTTTDFSKLEQKYDLIFDAVGKISFSKTKKVLTKRGVFLEAGMGIGIMSTVLWTKLFTKKKAKIAATGLRKPNERLKDLILLKSLLEDGKIKPVIDRIYNLEEIVTAHTYVEQGHKKGNVAITINH